MCYYFIFILFFSPTFLPHYYAHTHTHTHDPLPSQAANKDPRFRNPLKGSAPIQSAPVKICVLLKAALGGITFKDFGLTQETHTVFTRAQRICRAMLECVFFFLSLSLIFSRAQHYLYFSFSLIRHLCLRSGLRCGNARAPRHCCLLWTCIAPWWRARGPSPAHRCCVSCPALVRPSASVWPPPTSPRSKRCAKRRRATLSWWVSGCSLCFVVNIFRCFFFFFSGMAFHLFNL